MIAFNLIETFFFLTLGITFALIILLVYHFKKRITSMEQKCDTMFDIVQNVAKEITIIKKDQTLFSINEMNCNPFTKKCTQPSVDMNNIHSFMFGMNPIDPISMSFMNFSNANENNTIHMSKSEIEEVEDDEDDEDDDEDEDDDDEDEDDEDEDDDDKEQIKEYDLSKNKSYDSILMTDDIKIINIKDEIMGLSNINDIDDDESLHKDLDTNNENQESILQSDVIEIINHEQILVNKLDTTMTTDENNTQSSFDKQPLQISEEISKEIYKKMSLQELKKTVISKGLCSDTSKLKKPDLLKILLE